MLQTKNPISISVEALWGLHIISISLITLENVTFVRPISMAKRTRKKNEKDIFSALFHFSIFASSSSHSKTK